MGGKICDSCGQFALTPIEETVECYPLTMIQGTDPAYCFPVTVATFGAHYKPEGRNLAMYAKGQKARDILMSDEVAARKAYRRMEAAGAHGTTIVDLQPTWLVKAAMRNAARKIDEYRDRIAELERRIKTDEGE